MMIFRVIVVILFSSFNASASSFTDPISDSTRALLLQKKAAVEKWAPTTSKGAMAQNSNGEQGDIIQRSGLMCLFGDMARCEDVRLAQSPDGQFWRGETGINTNFGDSFSRDHLNGVLAYLAATKDTASAIRYYNFIKENGGMCKDESDNRCKPLLFGWGTIGEVFKFIGLKKDRNMKLGSLVDNIGYQFESRFAPKGFTAVLPAYQMLIRQYIGKWSFDLKAVAKVLKNRNPFSLLARYPGEGPTEELAQILLEVCPDQKLIPSDRQFPDTTYYDFIWNRDLVRDQKSGEIYVKRNWTGTEYLPAKMLVDGWDCLLGIQMLLHPIPFWQERLAK